MSARITRLSGHAEVISPASSMPTGPAPSRSTDSAAAISALRARYFAVAAAASSTSLFAGNGYDDPVARTTKSGRISAPDPSRTRSAETCAARSRTTRPLSSRRLYGRKMRGAKAGSTTARRAPMLWTKGVPGLDEDDVGEVVERTSDDRAAVTAADDSDHGPRLRGLRSCAHITACARVARRARRTTS